MREPRYELTDLAKWYVLARATDLDKWRQLGKRRPPMPPKPPAPEPKP